MTDETPNRKWRCTNTWLPGRPFWQLSPDDPSVPGVVECVLDDVDPNGGVPKLRRPAGNLAPSWRIIGGDDDVPTNERAPDVPPSKSTVSTQGTTVTGGPRPVIDVDPVTPPTYTPFTGGLSETNWLRGPWNGTTTVDVQRRPADTADTESPTANPNPRFPWWLLLVALALAAWLSK